MSNYEITGEIIVIADTQTFASGFTKREFVIKTTEEKYPQDLKFELVKDGCAKIEHYDLGDTVTVSFNVQGNEYNGRYFINLRAWKITGEGNSQPMQSARPTTQNRAKPPTPAPAEDDFEEEDDIPF